MPGSRTLVTSSSRAATVLLSRSIRTRTRGGSCVAPMAQSLHPRGAERTGAQPVEGVTIPWSHRARSTAGRGLMNRELAQMHLQAAELAHEGSRVELREPPHHILVI